MAFTTSSQSILIAGCSVRAAAWSARQAGISVIAADQFGDVDLLRHAERWLSLSADYHELPDYLVDAEIEGWIYTGGIENHPRLIASCAEQSRLFGVGSDAVYKLRDPYLFRDIILTCGGRMPIMRPVTDLIPAGDWLVKPYHSGGGVRVQHAGEATGSVEGCYWQRRVPGVPYSISFTALGNEAYLLGAVRQFIATSPEIQVARSIRRKHPFLFCGGVTAKLEELGDSEELRQFLGRVVEAIGLVGWCGMDVIKTASGQFEVLEINPRYTATMELLERQQQRSFYPLHLDACRGTPLDQTLEAPPMQERPGISVAKQILYTPTDLPIPTDGVGTLLGGRFVDDETSDILLADQPQPGSLLPAGSPICTLIAHGTTEDEALRTLRYHAGRLAIVLDQEKWSEYHRDL
ncbi:MAG: hypothetical protein CMJ46_13855 [Planctomyces sp.]|nr:hypothetical protein [Planctomyces sp.]